MNKLLFLVFSLCILALPSKSQTVPSTVFREIVLKTDTCQFIYPGDVINFKNNFYLAFSFNKPDDVCELDLYPTVASNITSVELLKSSDFVQLDTVVFLNQVYFRTKVKFTDLQRSQFLNFTFKAHFRDTVIKPILQEIKLFPYTRTTVNFYPGSDELFIGEEKVFELLTNNIHNIKITNEWTTGQDINYRVSEHNGQLSVHLLPSAFGSRTVNIKLQTNSPFMNDKKEVIYDLPIISYPFKVKASRLAFLNMDKKEVTFDETTRKTGIELQIDNHRQLQVGKTYRIEDQEQPGGPLIAELFTKSYLANDRVLCILRPFNLHRQTEGYLYIKDGDDAKFITNVGITPKTSIQSIQVMHEGQSWAPNLNVYPGETIDVKIEGEGFHKAKFHCEDMIDITSDTLIRNENICFFKLKVPLTINKHRVSLYNNSVNTGMGLNISEYQLPRDFDFVNINYGSGNKTISSLAPTVIQRKTIKDVTIGFNNSKIDSENKLFGKQYLDVDVRLVNKSGVLIEMKSIKNLVVCPDESSPRAVYYKDKGYTNANIDLNSYLSNKTYNLEDFSKIQLEIKQPSEKYSEPTHTKQVDIVLQRPYVFDINVSFPTGLLIQNLGKTQDEKDELATYNSEYAQYQIDLEKYNNGTTSTKPTEPTKPTKATFTDNLGSISLALIMQFSFPDEEKVGQSKPYRIGAGFLAINAFDFNQSAKRDLAAVVLGSIYPIKPGKWFNLPIHFGFGYKFQDKIPFVMLSPGLGISF
jgi:hypothetical protein